MKNYRIIVFTLIILVLSSTSSFANMEDKLQGHWAKDAISKDFLSRYFPYLARDNFSEFKADDPQDRNAFALSTASLFKAKGYIVDGMESSGQLSRREMLTIIGSRLKKIGVEPKENHNLEFIDIGGLSLQEKGYLRILNRENIVLGVGRGKFNPDRKFTQAEAVVVLQRLESFLNRQNKISFITRSVETSYNSKEEILVLADEFNVLVSITKQFPTPGYSLAAKEILKQGNTFKIYLETASPPINSIQPQVIVYKTISIELSKTELGDGPYNFAVEGFNQT